MSVQVGVDLASSGTRRVAVERGLAGFRVAPDGARGGTTIIGVPSPALTFRTLSFPFGDRRRLDTIVRQELENSLAFPLTDAVWDYVSRPPDPQGGPNVFAVACPRSRLDDVLERLDGEAAGDVDGEPYAYQRVLTWARVPDALVMDVGHSRTTVCRVTRGHLDSVRVMLHGARELTREGLEQGLASPAARAFFERLLDEAMLPATPAEVPLFLAGGGAQAAGLMEWLSERLGRPARPMPMPEGLSPYAHVVAFGMALAGIKGGESVRLQSRATAGRPLAVTVGILVVLALGLVAVDLRLHELSLRHRVDAYAVAIESVARMAAPSINARAMVVEQLRSLVNARKGGGSGTGVLPTLRAISQALQAAETESGGGGFKVFELDVGGGEVRMRGEAGGLKEVEALRTALGKLGKVDAGSTRSLGENRFSFQMRVTLGEASS